MNNYYVSKNGSDSNAGTETSPWLTIQKAANTVKAGSTVNIMNGVYSEKININASGNATDGFITFQSMAGNTVVIDGTNIKVVETTALININGKSYVRIKGLQICNLKTTVKNTVPIGIFVTGASSNIEILNNYVHHIANIASIRLGGSGRDAHGIAVYGTNAITNLTIDGNEVAFCTLGSSESVVVNGNVDGFKITNNIVHDNDNIGIDCIGFEGTATANDQARNGLVSGNTVYNITSLGNPSYPAGETCADGIYVDGGKDTIIERNIVHNVDIGIEVASEHKGKTTTGIVVRNNLVYKCSYTGLAFGGYSTGVGTTSNCFFTNNTLIQNDTNKSYTGDILVQKSNNNFIKNNIIYTSSQNIPMSNPFRVAYSYNNVFDNNLYFAPGGVNKTVWNFNNKSYTGFSAYKTASKQDGNSIFADPLFVDLMNFDVHIVENSPAINKGATNCLSVSEKDLYGNDRWLGVNVDIGACEKQ